MERFFSPTGLVDCWYHTDTHQLLEGVIPSWSEVKEKLLEISAYIPQVVYMGFDVVVTENGFKILEINSHEGIELNQTCAPYMKNEPTKPFFETLLRKRGID